MSVYHFDIQKGNPEDNLPIEKQKGDWVVYIVGSWGSCPRRFNAKNPREAYELADKYVSGKTLSVGQIMHYTMWKELQDMQQERMKDFKLQDLFMPTLKLNKSLPSLIRDEVKEG